MNTITAVKRYYNILLFTFHTAAWHSSDQFKWQYVNDCRQTVLSSTACILVAVHQPHWQQNCPQTLSTVDISLLETEVKCHNHRQFDYITTHCYCHLSLNCPTFCGRHKLGRDHTVRLTQLSRCWALRSFSWPVEWSRVGRCDHGLRLHPAKVNFCGFL